MSDEFQRNLALLCSYQRSIADVCRKLGLNRQQFNKYLAGQSRPSRHNMRRICDYFGVTEAELFSDTSRFEDMITLKQKPIGDGDYKPLYHLEQLYKRSQSLEKYVGYYFRYFYSFGNQGMVFRSIASIHEEEGRYFWKNIEILRDPETGQNRGLNKYEGALFYLADRIYVMEYETLEKNSVTQMTLYPSHQSRLGTLVGIQTGGPTRRGRKPGASRVALEYLGRDIDLRQAFRRIGLFDPAKGHIRQQMLDLIDNHLAPGSFVLDVEEP